jgi:cell fate (sporulation/competence/biofilm development) regulator YlbF (YheA/YmcA/DUF963 family)
MSTASALRDNANNNKLLEACLYLQESFSTPSKTGQLAFNQIKRAARHTVELIGYEWVLQMQRERNDAVRISMVFSELKRIVKRSLFSWHKDPARVWRDFEKYALKIASMREAKKLLKTYRLVP